jgi:hypothetical protein
MRKLIFFILTISLTSCLSSQSGIDPLGSKVTVYRDYNGKVVKHIREDDSKVTIVYYSKR